MEWLIPKHWNSAAIVSIHKKGVLSDCYNYRGISLINVGLKIISKIVTTRISEFGFSNMYVKVSKSLNSLTNNTIPIHFKKMVLQSFIISKALCYALLLGSYKIRTARVQSLLNKGILWCIGSYFNDKKTPKDIARNSYLSIYALFRDLCIPPLVGICSTQQLKCFFKWKSSKYMIKDLINFIPTHNSFLLD